MLHKSVQIAGSAVEVYDHIKQLKKGFKPLVKLQYPYKVKQLHGFKNFTGKIEIECLYVQAVCVLRFYESHNTMVPAHPD